MEFLMSKLTVDQDARQQQWDWDLSVAVPICAAIAGTQKTKELLPALKKLASQKLGDTSAICSDSITAITDTGNAQDAPADADKSRR
jgi:hypothetical protein